MPVSCNRFYVNLGSISSTCLCAAFTRADPKSAKRQSSHQSKKVGQLFFDCTQVKAARKHVDEIDPWFDFVKRKFLFRNETSRKGKMKSVRRENNLIREKKENKIVLFLTFFGVSERIDDTGVARLFCSRVKLKRYMLRLYTSRPSNGG